MIKGIVCCTYDWAIGKVNKETGKGEVSQETFWSGALTILLLFPELPRWCAVIILLMQEMQVLSLGQKDPLE